MVTKKEILDYAEEKRVFTVDEISRQFNVMKKDRHNLCNVLSRLCKANKLYRYNKGMYGYVFYNSLFNIARHCSEDVAFADLYTRNNEGYVSGADFFYMINLSTWLPAKKVVVTNKVKKEKTMETAVFLPPKTRITKENIYYLQLLDCLENFHNFAVDAPNPYWLLKRYIVKRQLDIPMLINLAQKYYSQTALDELNNCLEVNYYENARG